MLKQIGALKRWGKRNKKIYMFLKIFYFPISIINKIKFKRNVDALAIEAERDLRKMKTNKNNIFYFGIPIHNNLGDLAQTYCITKWCKDNYPDYGLMKIKTKATFNRKFQAMLKSKIKKEDIIIIQSGYCTQEKHWDHVMHRYIVSNYPDNRIIIMPQTVNFQKKKEMEKTAAIYNKHRSLIFIARDKISYNVAQKAFSQISVLLYPDVVTSLIGTIPLREKREGVLLCVRNDMEKLYTDKQIDSLRKGLLQDYSRVEVTDTNSNLPYNELMANLEDELISKFKEFASYEVIITDRYHGTIFSLIANTPVVVLATTDHKVTTGVNWFEGIYDDTVKVANSLDEALILAKKFARNTQMINNKEYFQSNYYSRLKKVIEQTI